MNTTRDTIRGWLAKRKPKHTHMIVVTDTSSYEDYPVLTSDVTADIDKYDGVNMQIIMEVYNLSMDLEEQIAADRVWNV